MIDNDDEVHVSCPVWCDDKMGNTKTASPTARGSSETGIPGMVHAVTAQSVESSWTSALHSALFQIQDKRPQGPRNPSSQPYCALFGDAKS